MTTPFTSSSVIFTDPANDNQIDSLLNGTRWMNSTISYSFPASNSPFFWSTLSGSGYGSQFGDGEPWNSAAKPLTSADQGYFENALQQWANVANVNFIKVSETPSDVGDIRAAYTEDPDELTLAWSYLPSNSPKSGDIWMNTQSLPTSLRLTPGTISPLKHSYMKSAMLWASNTPLQTLMTQRKRRFRPPWIASCIPS